MLHISTPKSDVTVSQMHVPPPPLQKENKRKKNQKNNKSNNKNNKQTNRLSKGSGWGKEIIMWSFEQNESDIKVNSVLNRSGFNAKKFFKQFDCIGKHNL